MSNHQPSDDAILITRAVLKLGRRLRAARPASTASVSGIGLLFTLHRLGPMPAARLAEHEQLQPQSLTRLIAGLEAKGLIERWPGEIDRRILMLTITPRGRQALKLEMDGRRRWLDEAMTESLTPAERRLLADAAPTMLKLAGETGADEDDRLILS